MPFTPFHFGPGYLMEACLPKQRWFSFYVFAFSQVVIDCETLYNLLLHSNRLHTFFHTYLGSLVAALITSVLANPFFTVAYRLLSLVFELKVLLEKLKVWPRNLLSPKVIFFSAWAGAWSHVLFDSINHSDVTPFWPYSKANPFYDWVESTNLYMGFFFLGLAGFAMVLWMNFREPSS